MAPHSSTLAWKIPWTERPGRLQSMGLRTVGHDWVTSLSLFNFMHWRRKWQPTPLFLPGESLGRGSLVGCCMWGRTESDMTKAPVTGEPSMAERSYPTSEIRGRSQEDPMPEGQRPWGVTPRSRSGVVAERSYPTPETGVAGGRSNPTSKEQLLSGRRRA